MYEMSTITTEQLRERVLRETDVRESAFFAMLTLLACADSFEEFQHTARDIILDIEIDAVHRSAERATAEAAR
jgi:hypothetical protein